ncbi:glucan endo-1,3-beta-D-glucosidase-like [Aristolochia californica]|uniref:glucan endo-1,3-beta-D-glucosidase-like n=1 Tax=Aristolochia californica TaxID=171875 RepID=UPI0035E05453
MAVMVRSLSKLSLFLLVLLFSSGWTSKFVQATKTWCVAKPSSDDSTLLANINWACSQVDCSVIQKGFNCFYPNSLINHASVSMNLYYQTRGRKPWNCVFKDSALVVMTDPSYGNCIYPYL